MPKRLQRKRTKGWRKPANAVIVDRTSRWGNPFRPYSSVYIENHHLRMGNAREGSVTLVQVGSREHSIELFRLYAWTRAYQDPQWLAPLVGKDLLCYCDLDRPCHADVLLELANRDQREAI